MDVVRKLPVTLILVSLTCSGVAHLHLHQRSGSPQGPSSCLSPPGHPILHGWLPAPAQYGHISSSQMHAVEVRGSKSRYYPELSSPFQKQWDWPKPWRTYCNEQASIAHGLTK